MDIPTMFAAVPEANVTFCVDTSGSMYESLPVIKQHLVESLYKMANSGREMMFNIVEFNSEVTQWADKMVVCTPETVNVASEWIDKISASSGTNTLDALLTAFDDDACDAVYLITDSLPDQHPTVVLDNVMLTSQSRPVHCVYVCSGGKLDPRVHDFLENLSYDTYASYHVISLTKHGCFEKVEPVVSMESLKQRVIRSDVGYPMANQKTCSVTTSLQVDPELWPARCLSYHNSYFNAPVSYGFIPYTPLQHLGSPQNWVRYRPARGWLMSQKEMLDGFTNVSLAAGALLIDKSVLVRRHEDGYFYHGIVRSQIACKKFLVAIGPCTQGKFRNTVYQETYDYDIISYPDSKKHTIIVGDKVLAPWQPDGEKFSVAVVIDGQELRHTDFPIAVGSDETRGVTVKFNNGTTQDIPVNQAIWIPPDLYDRLTLEQRMPHSAKNNLIAHSDDYPTKTLSGYPNSSVKAVPTDFPIAPEIDLKYEPIIYPYLDFPKYYPYYGYPYAVPYPVVYKKHKKVKAVSAVDSDEMNKLIPGTKLTAGELQEKVAAQLCENQPECTVDKKLPHKDKGCLKSSTTDFDDVKDDRKSDDCTKSGKVDKILHKRETVNENGLKKSVTWKADGIDQEVNKHAEKEFCEESDCDSGFINSPDAVTNDSFKYYPADVYTHGYHSYKPCSYVDENSARAKVPWKYWRSDARPELIGPPMHEEFRESILPPPLELRHKVRDNSHFHHVSHRTEPLSDSVDMLHTPHPPQGEPTKKQGPGVEIGSVVGEKQRELDAKQETYNETKRLRCAWRAEDLAKRRTEEQNAQKMKEVNRYMQQEDRGIQENQRRERQEASIARAQETKRKMAAEILERQTDKHVDAADRESLRINARRVNREMREADAQLRNTDWENALQRERESKLQRHMDRCESHDQKLAEKENREKRDERRCQSAKLSRLRAFREREANHTYKKELKMKMDRQHLDTYKSQVFS